PAVQPGVAEVWGIRGEVDDGSAGLWAGARQGKR
ncbi:MAG: hypothetical protein ACJA0P_003239, partial [Planctomycetota bacterium]